MYKLQGKGLFGVKKNKFENNRVTPRRGRGRGVAWQIEILSREGKEITQVPA